MNHAGGLERQRLEAEVAGSDGVGLAIAKASGECRCFPAGMSVFLCNMPERHSVTKDGAQKRT
jgi:hypothetical protein